MYSKIIVNIILILSLVIVQLSFISGLPMGLDNLNLILVVLVFILGLINLDLAIWWVIGAGVLLDIFSFLPFGVYLICLSLMIIIINFLLVNFFTDRSLYSFLALTGLATLIYEFSFGAFSYLTLRISGNEMNFVLNKSFWLAKLSQLSLNLAVAFVIFYLVNFVSKKLKPVFLVKDK